MSQIFHRSTNTLSRVSIFGGVFVAAGGALADPRGEPLALRDPRPRGAQPAGPLQPRAPRGRARHRLPLLPHLGGQVGLRGHPAHQDLHELPLADLEPEPHARAGARELPHRHLDRVDEGPRPARLRLLQPQRPREQGRGLLHLPRARRPDAARLAGEVAADGVVPGVPPPAREVPAAEVRGLQHRLRAARRPARAGTEAGEGLQHQARRSPAPRATDEPGTGRRDPRGTSPASAAGSTAASGRRYWKSLEELADEPGLPGVPAPRVPRAGLEPSTTRRAAASS